MTVSVRSLRGVYTERGECARDDRGNPVARYRELSSQCILAELGLLG